MTVALATPRSSILIVDDTLANIEMLYAMMSPDYEVLFATNGAQGLDLALALNPDLILLDMSMPGMDGLAVCRRLKTDPATEHIPVVLLTATQDDGQEETGLQAGAIDYITKPFNPAVVRRRLTNHLALKRYQDMLAQQAWLDGLTGALNRRQFDQCLAQEWQRALRSQASLALIMIDIDHFKAYNDRHGHLAGDDSLKAVAQTLIQVPNRATDKVFRYGGEEFACLLPGTNRIGAQVVAERMRARIQALHIPRNDLPGSDRVTVSFGAASLVPARGASERSLIEQADRALYQAKAMGRNQVR